MVSATRFILADGFIVEINAKEMDSIWFEQNSATSRGATINILLPIFEYCLNSKNVDKKWLPRSCDLTPLTYFFWKAEKYKHCVNILRPKGQKILSAVAKIRSETIENLIKKFFWPHGLLPSQSLWTFDWNYFLWMWMSWTYLFT